MRLHHSLGVFALAVLVACGTPPAQLAREEGAAPAPERSDNTISREELEDARSSNVYDAIVKLRKNFLSNRGVTTIKGTAQSLPVVYLDGVVYGTINDLKNISTNGVASIRLYRAWESAKFGPDKTGGVIEIISRRQ